MTHKTLKLPIIPEQIKGDSHDVVSMVCTNSIDSAAFLYNETVERLKSVNLWYSYSDKVKAKFTLIHSETELETNALTKENLIRIEIPGPGTISGKGYDWTRIIDIQDDETIDVPFFALTIKPCSPPNADKEITAHFYKHNASNTLIIRRIGNCVYAEAHGRNEIVNISEAPLIDSIRNMGINLGSKVGLGSMNWLGLTKALLEP